MRSIKALKCKCATKKGRKLPKICIRNKERKNKKKTKKSVDN